MIAQPNQKHQLPITYVIARRATPDVAIRIPCDAKHHLLPSGAERKRIATA